MEKDSAKLCQLNSGLIPHHEPGLEELVQQQYRARNLKFSDDLPSALSGSSVVFIAVGTPSREDGYVDLTDVYEVADEIGKTPTEFLTVSLKSTVPVGTAEEVHRRIARHHQGNFSVVSNPEFLREGRAIYDFLNPDRVLIGGQDEKAIDLVKQIYTSFVPEENILVMNARSAEMAKYTSNAFLATRISFINEIAALCERVGADVEQVKLAVGRDPRIGLKYLDPGLGFGGSCLPKDIRALLALGKAYSAELELLSAVYDVNMRQPHRMLEKISLHFSDALDGRCITVWGLAFKGGTDDVRESPAIPLIHYLVNRGVNVTVHDPKLNRNAHTILGNGVQFNGCMRGSVRKADALVIATDWEEFRGVDLSQVISLMKSPVIFDGRNLLDPVQMKELGVTYYGTGRSA
jgi:UDPglucose 6-dehydrogenase